MSRTPFLAAAILLLLPIVVTGTAQSPVNLSPDALTAAYQQAMQARDWASAVADAQQLVALHASAANLLLLANAQLYSGAGEPALTTYDRAFDAAQQEKPAPGQPDTAWKDQLAKGYTDKGNALLKLHRNSDAVDAYNHAAELASNPGPALFDICALLYNTGDTKNGAGACRKAAAADPAFADTWFVLGSTLFTEAKIDRKQNKPIVSAECRQAFEKYLQLAPDGPHAGEVKDMLDMAAK